MDEPNDIELLRQFVEDHSEAAITALVRRQINLVYSAALRITRNPHAAEEVTQISIISSESILVQGSGQTDPDWQITGDLTVNLRAERSGSGIGRVYSISVQCTDDSGNLSTEVARVTVPHDPSQIKVPSGSHPETAR